MSVLIKGMEMPTNCFDCNFAVDGTCVAMRPIRTRNWKAKDTTNYCPLIPVPPHGRLIDADELMHEFEKAQQTMAQHGQEYSCSFMSSSQELSTEWYCVEDMLENAPTLLEAEEGET